MARFRLRQGYVEAGGDANERGRWVCVGANPPCHAAGFRAETYQRGYPHGSRRGLNLGAPPGGFKLAAPFGAVNDKFHLACCQMKHFASRRSYLGVASAKTEAQRAKTGAGWISANACVLTTPVRANHCAPLAHARQFNSIGSISISPRDKSPTRSRWYRMMSIQCRSSPSFEGLI